MYDDIVHGVDETIEIDGYPFYAIEITGNESFNRREINRKPILGGTEYVTRGKYVPRDFKFSTYIHVPESRPEKYDAIFEEMVSKPCEVLSRYMGGKFMAEVIIQKSFEEASPQDIKLDIQVIEIPEISRIPSDIFPVPKDKLMS